MAAVRIFASLPLLPEIAGRVAKLVSELQPLQKAGLKWAGPETWHFTLAFLGTMEDDGVMRVKQACGLVAGRHRPFALSLGSLGIFPLRGEGRVLWVGLSQGQENLVSVQRDLAAELQARGFAKEDRPFVPHLTLARAKTGAQVGRQLAQADTSGLAAFRQCASCLEVMRSELLASGPRYTVLAAYPFRKT